MLQINALATVAGIFMPAFFPRCHILHEVESLHIAAPYFPNFLEVSPDGVIKCVQNCGNCRNLMEVPIGTMCLELKCPYTPIHDKKLLPVQYNPPQYYCCQLLSQMRATNTDIMLFGSCSPESMAISFVDNCKKTWRPLWGLARELYADSSLTKPTALHGESTALRPALKTFSEHNSTFVAELLVLTGVNNSLESRYLPPDNLYQFVDSISNEYLDGEDINKQIFDLSQESYKLILKAHNLQRCKASEVLLFVCTDSDRAFNKDKPSSIPIVYALKGKSIRISTARKMINMVRDKLKDNGTSILCEVVDGQWSGIVFRDESLKPLTLFELQRDSWLKFAKMSKENILLFLHNLSYVSYADKDLCSRININYFASHHYGNIEVHIDPFWRPADGVVVRRIFVHSYCGKYNQGSVLNMLKTPLKAERQDLWHKSIGVSNNLLQVLGLQEPSTVTGDEAPLTEAVLLGSHKCVLEDILIALLCSDNCIKWSAYNCREFYEFALSSTNAIYTSMTTHDIDIVINVLRKWECPSVSLGMKLNVSKLQKANQLGFILGHTDFIGAKKTKPKMKSLVDLTLDELKLSVPVEVLHVALSQFDFRMKFASVDGQMSPSNLL